MLKINYEEFSVDQLRNMIDDIGKVITKKTQEKRQNLLRIIIKDLEVFEKEFPQEPIVYLESWEYSAGELANAINNFNDF